MNFHLTLHNHLCKCASDLNDHMHHRYKTLAANDLTVEIKQRAHMKHAGAGFNCTFSDVIMEILRVDWWISHKVCSGMVFVYIYCTIQQLCTSTIPLFASTPEIIFISKHKHTQFCHCMKENLCSETTQLCSFFPPTSSLPTQWSLSVRLSLLGCKMTAHLHDEKKETRVCLIFLSSPCLPFSSSCRPCSLGTDNCQESRSLFLLVPLLGSNDGKPFEVRRGSGTNYRILV